MLTVIGLGDGPDSLSLGALRALRAASGPTLARTRAHPAVRWLEAEGGVTFDLALDGLGTEAAVARVLGAARSGDAVYALPGHPLFGDPTGVPLEAAARSAGLELRVFFPTPAPADTPATGLDALVQVMARLRDPLAGCPWDREQTPQTLRRYVIEEAYEVVEAVDADDPVKLAEELGDLLLQVVFHAQLAGQAGRFTLDGVTRAIVGKLLRRHPHVFGDVSVTGTDQVLANWERIKRAEPGYEDRRSLLDGIPPALPALMRALEVSKRVVKVGFEWPTVGKVLDKVEEEIRELRAEIERGETARAGEELGDLLFTLVNVARQLRVDPEEALRAMTRRFAARFRRIEQHAADTHRAVSDLSLIEMEEVWQAAKGKDDAVSGSRPQRKESHPSAKKWQKK